MDIQIKKTLIVFSTAKFLVKNLRSNLNKSNVTSTCKFVHRFSNGCCSMNHFGHPSLILCKSDLPTYVISWSNNKHIEYSSQRPISDVFMLTITMGSVLVLPARECSRQIFRITHIRTTRWWLWHNKALTLLISIIGMQLIGT